MGGRKGRRASLAVKLCNAGATRYRTLFQAFGGPDLRALAPYRRGSHRIVYASLNGPRVSRVKALSGRRARLQRLTRTRALLTLPLPSIARKEIVCSPAPSSGSSSA